MNADSQPADDARSWPRHAARASIVAPFTALLLGALSKPLMHNQPEAVANQINFVVGCVASLIIVAGLAAGVAALAGAWRQGSPDTRTIAGLGLFAGGCVVLLWIAAYVFVAGAR
jgi:hypothetical protein